MTELKDMTADELKERVAELNDEVRDRYEEHGRARRQLRDAEMELVAKEEGVKVGAVVLDRTGRRYLVTGVERRAWAKVAQLKGKLQKKDGSWGVQDHYVHPPVKGGWEVAEEPKEEETDEA